jgi:hypothetical protein
MGPLAAASACTCGLSALLKELSNGMGLAPPEARGVKDEAALAVASEYCDELGARIRDAKMPDPVSDPSAYEGAIREDVSSGEDADPVPAHGTRFRALQRGHKLYVLPWDCGFPIDTRENEVLLRESDYVFDVAQGIATKNRTGRIPPRVVKTVRGPHQAVLTDYLSGRFVPGLGPEPIDTVEGLCKGALGALKHADGERAKWEQTAERIGEQRDAARAVGKAIADSLGPEDYPPPKSESFAKLEREMFDPGFIAEADAEYAKVWREAHGAEEIAVVKSEPIQVPSDVVKVVLFDAHGRHDPHAPRWHCRCGSANVPAWRFECDRC